MIRILLKSYAFEFREPLRTAHGLWSVREGVLVKLEDAHGRIGYGEASPVPGFGRETTATVQARLAAIGDKSTDEAIDEVVIQEGGTVGFALAAARAEMAGGTELTRVHDYLPVAALLPAGRGATRVAMERAEMGFRTFKLKVGVADPRDERGWLDEVLAELPAESRVRLDANGAWERRQAEGWLDYCADRAMIEFVEQPVAAGGAKMEDLLRGLAEDYPTKLALDESLVGREDLWRWIDGEWSGVWVLKVALLGDPSALQHVIKTHGLDVVYSSALETAVGARSLYEMAFAHAGKSRELGTGVWPLFTDRRANGPTAMPFVRWSDVETLNKEELWNAVS